MDITPEPSLSDPATVESEVPVGVNPKHRTAQYKLCVGPSCWGCHQVDDSTEVTATLSPEDWLRRFQRALLGISV